MNKKKVLLSLLVVLGVSAMAVTATSALFSDTEVSADNTFTAGAVDLTVGYESTYNGGTGPGWLLRDIDGGDLFFAFGDVKPLDEGEGTITLNITDNPSWVRMVINGLENAENGCTEPEYDAERVVNPPDGTCDNPGPGLGELEDYLTMLMWIDLDGNDTYTAGVDTLVFEGTLSALASGVYADFGVVTPDGDPNTADATVRVNWTVPDDENINVIQTDSVMFDVTFEAVQERNNPTPW